MVLWHQITINNPALYKKKKLEKGCGGWVFKDMKVSILINHNVIKKNHQTKLAV